MVLLYQSIFTHTDKIGAKPWVIPRNATKPANQVESEDEQDVGCHVRSKNEVAAPPVQEPIQSTTPVQEQLNTKNNVVETGTILQEIQAGYMLGERLLRPALVGIAKNNEENEEKKEKISL